MKQFCLLICILFLLCLLFGCSNNAQQSPQGEYYYEFDRFIAENPHDKLYNQKITEGEVPLNQIAEDYLWAWRNELTATVTEARKFFDDENDYNLWCEQMNEWLSTSDDMFLSEQNRLIENSAGSLYLYEHKITYAEQLRQKVIDTKYLLYVIETNCESQLDDLTSLKWHS